MEREPDYGQYWQPEGQPAEGYYGQQQPAYGQVDYSQTGYSSEQYQPDPNQDPSQDPQDPNPPQDPYGQQNQQQPYAFTGYEYAEHRPYAPGQYGDSGAGAGYGSGEAVESTAQWSTMDLIADPAPAAGLPGSESRLPSAEPTSGSSALGAGTNDGGGGRASRRAAARGRTSAPAGDTSTPAGSPLARLVAVATGRAPGTDRKTYLRRVGFGAAALVVLAAAGYAVAGSGSGSSNTSADSAGTAPAASITAGHTKIWAAPADAGSANDNDGLVGSWILPTAVVRGDGTGVTAYSTSNGSKLWTLTPPSAGAVPCGMSPTISSSGMGVVLFQAKPGTGQACTQLVAIDSSTGTQKWTAKISGSGSAYGASVMVDDTTAVAVGSSGAIGYNLGTGKQSWTYTGPGKYCALAGSGTAGTVLLQSTCADSSPKQQAIALNTDTGKLNWWRGLPSNAASYTVLSATPAVVSVHMADSSQDTLLSFSATGDPQATIPVAQVGGTLDSVHGSFDPVPALFFQGDTLFAELSPTNAASATGGASPNTSASGAVTAFNLATGKQLWQTAPLEKGQSALVGLDGSAVVIATEEQIGQPARLSHFDPTTGKESPGGSFPQGTGSLLTSGRVFYQGNLVVALPEFTSTYNTAATAFSVASGQ